MTETTTKPASIKQIDYILGLLAERDLSRPTDETLANLEMWEASQWITELLACSRPVTVGKKFAPPVVPSGRYALEVGENDYRFYRVDQITEGKWAGYTFVKVLASEQEYPIKGKGKNEVLAEIGKDIQGALLAYGQKMERCGLCNRALTTKASREAGIGPDCAKTL